MTYAELLQAPSPPLDISKSYDLAFTAKNTSKDIRQAASLQAFIDSKKKITLGALPEAVTHPAATLLQSYVEEGIPDTIGPLWLRTALDEAIQNGQHASACAPDMVSFILGYLQRRFQGRFSILLSTEDAVQVFGEKLKLSCITVSPQDQRRPQLILNLSAQPDKETPSVNVTTDREISPESMQFGRAFPHIIQAM